ncbi:hypothetical protein [Kitasatospora acidiphila]|uniref:hypothetical protein n=1 Tax=Kitasatospora acidiphila TaxID=2567942 RepID=UPI003C7768AE
MLSNRLVRSAVLCAALAVGATACGSKGATNSAAPAPASASAAASPSGPDLSTMSADQISDQAKTAMVSLTSARMAGTTNSDGQKISFKLQMDKQQNCTGTMGIGSSGNVELIHNSTNTWIKPDAAFWQAMAAQEGHAQQGPAIAKLLNGRWVTAPPGDQKMQQIAAMCGLLPHFADDTSKSTGATKGAPTTVNGTPALPINATDDSGPSTIYVATQGQPYALRIEDKSADGGTMDFSDFNKPFTVEAPPADQTIDYTVFQKKLTSV